MRITVAVLCVFLTATIAAAQSPLRPAVAADGLVYLSGIVAPGADAATQAPAAIAAAAALLKSSGSSLANVANVTVSLRSMADVAAINAAFAAAWPKDPPARTTIIVEQPLATPAALVELSMVAIPNGGERVVIQPKAWLKPPSPYSYGIKSGNTLFLAGLISRNGVDNTMVAGDMATQTKTVLDAASVILAEAGMTIADVVSSKVFIADPTAFQTMNGVYRTYWTASAPARATVKATPPGAGAIIEIAMVAVKDPERKQILPPNADGTPGRAGANLSPAIQVGRRLYVAGMLGSTPATKGDVKAQTAETVVRLGRALTAAGYDWSQVVDVQVFLPDMSRVAEMDEAYKAVFPKEFPARIVWGTPLMGADGLVEIMLTAVK